MTTEEDCIHALREAAQVLGKSPTKAEYEDLDITPSASTILRHCGGWNDAKEKAGLETNQSTGSRVEPKPDDVELPDGVEWEELSQDQRWHYRHKDKNVSRTLERRERLRSWVYEQKVARGCQECGYDNGQCLDFHHREDTRKWLEISLMVTFGYGIESLEEEMSKCDVFCANCHRLEHYHPPQRVRWDSNTAPEAFVEGTVADEPTLPDRRESQKAWLHEYKKLLGCNQCGVHEAGCLEFHHTDSDSKEQTVSQMVVTGCSGDELLAEIKKCSILCANCHREKHAEPPAYVGAIEVVDGIVRKQ